MAKVSGSEMAKKGDNVGCVIFPLKSKKINSAKLPSCVSDQTIFTTKKRTTNTYMARLKGSEIIKERDHNWLFDFSF